MSNTVVYFKDEVLTEEDYPLICHDFKIPFNQLSAAVDQIRTKNEPSWSLFQSTVRERIREWFKHVSLDLPEALVVDGTHEAAEEPEPEPAKPDAQPTPQTPPAPLPATENDQPDTNPAPRPESDVVVDSAACALMAAMTTNAGHFIINERGICSINRANPPTLVHAYQTVENVLKLDQLGDKVVDKACWAQGSLLAALEDEFGEEFSVSQVCDINTAAYNTLVTRLSVYKGFKDAQYNLSFSAHKEAFHCKIPRDSKLLILKKAETYELTTKHIRALGSIRRKMGDDTTIQNIKSRDAAIDLIEAYRQAKVKYLVFEDGQMVEINGLAGEIPEGKVVIDLKNRKWYADGALAGEIQKRGSKS